MPKMPLSVDSYTNYCRSIKNRSEKTVSEYEHDLLTFFRYIKAYNDGITVNEENLHEVDISTIGMKEISEITSEDIMRFLSYAAKDRKNSAVTRSRKLSSIKGFFKYLVTVRKELKENPAADIDAPKKKASLPKFLNLDESLALLDAVEKDVENPYRERDYCIITLFLNCGMRLSELTGLSLPDLDSELRSMRVVGKGNKERVIYLNEACADAIRKYIAVRGKQGEIKDKDALFISRNHRRISNQMVQKIVYKYLEMADLGNKHYSVHKLRHTAATLMYQTGKVDVRVLKDILGHEQLNTTQIYTHVSDKGMEDAMKQNPLSKKKK
ncbi:MAG: tyrosine recombinase XerC [Ruminococcaceae bacterium]|nr:tyrosine recombinase XerC [Oscillospiraceae bacterium]